jgi:hypothetical protein
LGFGISIVISQAIFSALAQGRFIEADTVQVIQKSKNLSRKLPFVSLIIQLTASVTPRFTQARFDEIAVHRIKNMVGCRWYHHPS